jgi:hypothetical protein
MRAALAALKAGWVDFGTDWRDAEKSPGRYRLVTSKY